MTELTVEALVTYVAENPELQERLGFLMFQTDPKQLKTLVASWEHDGEQPSPVTAFLAGAVAGWALRERA